MNQTQEGYNIQGWYPVGLHHESQSEVSVIWADLQDRVLSKPFFADELRSVPRNRYRTLPLDSLTEQDYSISLLPSAFIFHVSRCGSTLMVQQLMQSTRCHVLSEPPILEQVLSYSRQLPCPEQRKKLFLSAISALGRPASPHQTHFIIKLDCWHLADLPFIQQLFPDVPCFLLYREPEKVFASHQKQAGIQMIPGKVDTSALSVNTSSIPIYDLNSYQLEILRGLFTAALNQVEDEQTAVKLINYQQLPTITTKAFARAIKLDLTGQERAAMLRRAHKHSKNQSNDFKQEKLLSFSPCYKTRLQALTQQYQQLERLRSRQSWPDFPDSTIHNKEFVMTDAYHKLPLNFDVARLQQDLSQLQDSYWLKHINRRVHDGGWTALPLRAVDGEAGDATVVEMDPERYQSTPYLEQSEYLQEVLAGFDCTLVSARLMSLKAGEEIRRHTDMDLCFEDGCVRLHIPIQTHPDVTFLINDQPVHFAEGECWYMNANYPHQVSNNSEIDRVHLVIDCIVNDWLAELFISTGYEKTIVEHKYGSSGITDDNVLQIIEQLEYLGTETALGMAENLRNLWQKDQQQISDTV